MKKVAAILLGIMVLLITAVGLAEGSVCDKPINFANFTFGDTFQNIRSQEFIRSLEFRRVAYSPRFVADALSYAAEWTDQLASSALCFSASPEEMREVAGHECSVTLWFVYPVNDGVVAANEGAATLYAGGYDFWNGEARATFDDLKKKLTQVYGEPYAAGGDLDAVFGTAPISENMQNMYAEEIARYQPEYVIWKSSANNAAVVLKIYYENGDWERVKLDYILLDAQEQFEQMNFGGAVEEDNLAGL